MTQNRLDLGHEPALTVGQLAQQIRRVVQRDPILCDVTVRGEISNFKAHGSGHLYFTLKDDLAQLRCCMWRGQVAQLRFRPADGNRVLADGAVEFYGARGELSLIVRELRFDGHGALYEAFLQLKRELEAQGLFDPARKRALPPLPRRIGLITSPTGAVAHDVLTILRRRWPLARVVLIEAAVQGFGAAPDLIRALSWASTQDDLDLVIVARGGGSAEDLWCFNDEELARAASRFPIPLISAVGHETDFTIFDFVADLRAPTPSAAAELAAPDWREVQSGIDALRRRLHHAARADVYAARREVDYLRHRLALAHPARRLGELRALVAGLRARLRDSGRHRVKIERQDLNARLGQLRLLDPQRVLERGYALVTDARSGALLTGVAQLNAGRRITVRLRDGQAPAAVEAG